MSKSCFWIVALFCSLLFSGSSFAYSTTNYKASIKQGSSWHDTYTFGSSTSCGPYCSYWDVGLSYWCDDVDGASVLTYTPDGYDYYNWFYTLESDNNVIWYTGVEIENGYWLDELYNCNGWDDDHFTSEDLCDNMYFLKYYYRYDGWEQTFERKYRI